jgi:hypothetical protein
MESASPQIDRQPGPRVRVLRTASIALLVVCVLLQATALVKYVEDQYYLHTLISQIASPSLPPSQQAEAISMYLAFKQDDSLNSYVLLPIFRPLRPSAREVADDGGDCADRSRLMVVLLEMRNIHATKWALYTPSDQPKHAVVELRSEAGKMVIDPLYNMWFPKPNGGFYDIDDLRRDPSILRDRVLALRSVSNRRITQRINWYPLDQYIYTNARSINWDKSIVMRAAYRVLHAVFGHRVDDMWRPEFAEQPALIIAYGLVPIDALAIFVIAWADSKRRRNTGREAVPMAFKTERTSSY